jgi:hypothetical protein
VVRATWIRWIDDVDDTVALTETPLKSKASAFQEALMGSGMTAERPVTTTSLEATSADAGWDASDSTNRAVMTVAVKDDFFIGEEALYGVSYEQIIPNHKSVPNAFGDSVFQGKQKIQIGKKKVNSTRQS